MSRAKIPKRKSLVVGYCRFGLLKDEMALIDRAAFLEERTKGDFCRIASVRFARAVLAQHDQSALMPRIMAAINQDAEKPNKGDELPFKE